MKTLLRHEQFHIALIVAAFLLAFGLALFEIPLTNSAHAMAPTGLNAQVATSSTITVGPLNNVWSGFGTTTRETAYSCASRVISTVGQPIMISFASMSSTSLSQTVGFLQAASTSVAYDGGLYGCGYLTIRGLNASTTITLMETR